MLKTLLLLLSVAACTLGQTASGNRSVAVTPSGPATPPGSAPFGLSLDTSMSDEFNGSSIDTSKWTKGWQGSASCPCDFSNMAVSVSGGNLRLVNHLSGGVERPAGIYGNSNVLVMPPQPSYWEVRAIMPTGGNNTGSSVWAMDVNNAHVPHTEIDLQETLFNNMCSTVHMWSAGYASDLVSSGQPSVSGTGCGGSGTWTDGNYHIYGLYRANNQLQFYFDGQLANTITASGANSNLVFTSPANLILQTDGNNNLQGPEGSTMLVDYSRVYH